MSRKQVIVTPTTHWDREWIMTLEQYQVRLCHMMDKVFKLLETEPTYRFLLDGQLIMLEDYLAHCPERREQVAAYMREGRLVAGPWYVLADQFLQNSESTIRNLLMGHRLAKEFGGEAMPLGYVPDSFGCIATLPMFLRQFGLKYATFGRGRPYWVERLPHNEFWWQAPDGSRVFTANHSYANGLFLSYMEIFSDITTAYSLNPDPETVLARFLREIEAQATMAISDTLYLSVGVDHMEPRENLLTHLRYINERQGDWQLSYGMPYDYLRAAEKAAEGAVVYQGEMRGPEDPAHWMDLVGTLTSRMPLKLANATCEHLLQQGLEPLYSLLSVLTPTPYPTNHLQLMWKLLLAGHAHDSICGCGRDDVYIDLMNRYRQLETRGRYLLKEGLHALTAAIDTRSPWPEAVAVTVVNPLPGTYSGPVRGLIRIPKRFRFERCQLLDRQGRSIPAEICVVTEKRKDLETEYMTTSMLAEVLSKTVRPEAPDDQVFTVLSLSFLAEALPGMGYTTYWLLPAETEAPSDCMPAVQGSADRMENAYLRIALHSDGTYDLHDKRNGKTHRRLGALLDREDAGGTYDHAELPVAEEITSTDSVQCSWTVAEQTSFSITMRADFVLSLPARLEKTGRSAERRDCAVRQELTLYAGIDRLDVRLSFNNVCENHALRVAFDTDYTGERSYAFDHCNIIERPVHSGREIWREDPCQELFGMTDGITGLAISAKGIPAYEALRTERGVRLCLPLLRAVASIRHNVESVMGVVYRTPEAQCLGTHVFSYTLLPHTGGWQEGNVLARALDFQTEPLLEGDLQHEGTLASSGVLIALKAIDGEPAEPKPLPLCLKQAENGDGLICRVWNPGEGYAVKIEGDRIRTVQPVNLREEPTGPLGHPEDAWPLPARGLQSWRLRF